MRVCESQIVRSGDREGNRETQKEREEEEGEEEEEEGRVGGKEGGGRESARVCSGWLVQGEWGSERGKKPNGESALFAAHTPTHLALLDGNDAGPVVHPSFLTHNLYQGIDNAARCKHTDSFALLSSRHTKGCARRVGGGGRLWGLRAGASSTGAFSSRWCYRGPHHREPFELVVEAFERPLVRKCNCSEGRIVKARGRGHHAHNTTHHTTTQHNT